jgi:hypothetical protein
MNAYAKYLAILRHPVDDLASLKELLALYANLFEDAAAPLWAALLKLAQRSAKSYEMLLSEDAAELLRRVSAVPEIRRFSVGAVKDYRNAASHGHTFELEDETIVFRLRTFQQRVPISRFLDDAFAIIESVCAVQLVIDGFLAQ